MNSLSISEMSVHSLKDLTIRHQSNNTVVPFTKRKPTAKTSPCSVTSSPTSSPSKMLLVSQEEFTTMLEYDETAPSRLSNLGRSLYELSLSLRTISDVRNQILYFKENAPLKYYRYNCVTDLLLASVKCPPDMPYFILTMAAKMIKLGNVAPRSELKHFIRVTQRLINSGCFFISFKLDQEKPQKKLVKMLALFQGKLLSTSSTKGKTGKLSTGQIEKYLVSRNVELPSNCEETETEASLLDEEDIMGIDSNKYSDNYKPKVEIDELASVRLDVDPDHYTKEHQKSICFIKELNEGIPLAGLKRGMASFLSSTDDLFGRRKRGGNIYQNLNEEEIKKIMKLASMFSSWDVAYDASLMVWEVLKEDDDFDVDILLSQIAVSYGDFLIEALKTFAEAAGLRFAENYENPY